MTPQEIQDESNCMACIPDKNAAMLYLLNAIRVQNGGDVMTPQEITEASKCYGCIPDQAAAQTYLLSEISGSIV